LFKNVHLLLKNKNYQILTIIRVATRFQQTDWKKECQDIWSARPGENASARQTEFAVLWRSEWRRSRAANEHQPCQSDRKSTVTKKQIQTISPSFVLIKSYIYIW